MEGEPNQVPTIDSKPAEMLPPTKTPTQPIQPAVPSQPAPVKKIIPKTVPVRPNPKKPILPNKQVAPMTPQGEPKKSILKQWWLWAIIGIIVLGIIIGGILLLTSGNSEDNEGASAQGTTEKDSGNSASDIQNSADGYFPILISDEDPTKELSP